MISLPALVSEKQLLICIGGGGVGKTTTAAALGLTAAREGRRVAVLTIDPSHRLKDLLHMTRESNDPQMVPLPSGYGGRLYALVLDTKGVFDRLIHKFSPSPEVAERILKNRLYQNISGTLAGSQEYMAAEKLYELASGRSFDLVIVDTPPSYYTLDFLDAPHRLTALLNSRALAVLKNPSHMVRAGPRLAAATLAAILRGLQRFTGLGLLQDMVDFLSEVEGLATGFRGRAEAVAHLLRHNQTAFILVTTPEPFAVEETIRFACQIQDRGFPLVGAVVNRILPRSLTEPALLTSLPRGCQYLGEKLHSIHQGFRMVALRQHESLRRLTRGVGSLPILAWVPALEEEPVTLTHLEMITHHLYPQEDVRRQGSRAASPSRSRSKG